ncbi:uncharacterized protein LOC142625441 [Castanea sativa]|uniref:uncharacterized protein LOC142625441 n=1 Tax=Castanea sativa TaxID=21020 RepID=UPI003F64E812
MEINSIPYSVKAIQGEDRLIWMGANRGDFDLKHAYALAKGSELDAGSFNGMWVWKLDSIPWVKTFVWKCLHPLEWENALSKGALVKLISAIYHCGLNTKKSNYKRVVQIRWEIPQAGWACLNTDEATIGNPGRAWCGGLIRNKHGEWLGGFSRSIGCSNSFMVELWGLRDGLILCNEMHLNVVDIQLDAKAVVQLLSNSSSANICAMPLLDDCRQLISQIA